MKNNVLQFPTRKRAPSKGRVGARGELLAIPAHVALMGKIRNDVDLFEVRAR